MRKGSAFFMLGVALNPNILSKENVMKEVSHNLKHDKKIRYGQKPFSYRTKGSCSTRRRR